MTTVDNTTETAGGRFIESTEAFRTRLRSAPESQSTCGPRLAYEQHALDASPTVVDAKALGPQDGGDLASYPPEPGAVLVLIIEGERDSDGNVISVIPAPSNGLLETVRVALSAETVRPLTDYVYTGQPIFVDYDIDVTYYIARSRRAQTTEIRAAVEAAFAAWKLAQTRIGVDINPDALRAAIVNAGAKRCTVYSPSFTVILSDQCSRNGYGYDDVLTYGDIEND